MTFALGLLMAGLFPSADPVRIAVAPLVVTAPCKFAGPDLIQTREIMEKAALEFFGKACDATDYIFVHPLFVQGALEQTKIDFSKEGLRKKEKLQEFGKAVNATYAVVAVVDWTDQKNAEMRAIAANAGGLHSTSKVRVRLWLQNVADDALRIDGSKQSFEGEAKGPFFGTVNQRDMSGDPESKGIVIRNEYRQRAKALGKALVQALRGALQPVLGLKEPPL